MARKLQRATLKKGQRKSLRISIMEASCEAVVQSGNTTCTHKIARHLENEQGPASRTWGRKRKLRPVQELTVSPANQQEKQCDADIQRKNNESLEIASAIFMPEKHILELILNILQRRDSYEIFAEPVDPKEVEDYYEIIKEPMDFGTMRAKLHEEMYKSLEQFEHDVFLIFNNAMHFNSSRTIYFKQARTMNELAKKVFDVLKANLENFEREFSETVQRDGRRNQKDLKDSTNVKLHESSISMSSKYMAGSSNATPYRKSFKSDHGQSNIAKHVGDRIVENPTGTRNSGRHKSFEVDRRCTYRPYIYHSEEGKSIFETIDGKLKLLEKVNQQDIGYRESFMLFVKDVGQSVKSLVSRKLFGYEIHTGAALAPLRPNTINEIRAIDVYVKDDIDHDQSPLRVNIQRSQSMSMKCDKSYWSDLDHSRAFANKLHCLANGSKGIGIESRTISLDKSKSTIQEQMQNLRMERTRSDEEYVACSFEAGKIM